MKDYSELMLIIDKAMKDCYSNVLKGNINTASYYADMASYSASLLTQQLDSMSAKQMERSHGK